MSRPSHVSADGITFCWQTSAPFTQWNVPAAHTPMRPVLHAPPPPGSPSSIEPLQLLSLLSQISFEACVVCVHTIPPFWQFVRPAAHTPKRPVLHAEPPPGLPSSVAPLQLLSRPSHVSGADCVFWLHLISPFWQAVVPAAHAPSRPVLQPTPPPGLPSSTCPLQLSSRLLHDSFEGCTFCTQMTCAFWQEVVPGPQTPWLPVMQAMPPPGLPSSTKPLQLSSRPLHVSTLAGSGLQTLSTPFTQKGTVFAQMPRPQLMVPSPSSTWPLQLSSMLLQISAVGWPGVHTCVMPPMQFCVVTLHAPTPHTVEPSPSSIWPLQSLSLASHVSVSGSTSFMHGPHCPFAHVCVPAAHSPTPSVFGAPV